MASVVKIKRSSVQGKKPTTSDIVAGELALNTRDGKLFSSDGTAVFEIGANLHSLSIGTGGLTIGNGAFTLPTTDGTAGYSLTTDGNGNVTWQKGGEVTNAYLTSTFTTNTAFQSALANTNLYISAKVDTTTFNLSLANTNAYIAATAATELSHLANTNAYIANVNNTKATWSALISTNTAIRSLVSDRLQVANAQSLFVNVTGDTMTGYLTLHADPTQALHSATKQYVDNVATGVKTAPSCRALADSNLTATYNNGTSGVGASLTSTTNGALGTIDGIGAWNQYDGILVTAQTNPEENGRYFVSQVGDASNPWILIRCTFCDEANEIPGSYIFITDGTEYEGTGWIAIVNDPSTFTVGVDGIFYTQFSGAGTYTADGGLVLNGTQFSIADNISANTSGNAATATKLESARSITLNGVLSGSANFDGSSDITITGDIDVSGLPANTAAIISTDLIAVYDASLNTTYKVSIAEAALQGPQGAQGATGATGDPGYTSNTVTITSQTETVVDSWSAAAYFSAKYVIQARSTTVANERQVSEVLLVHNGANTFMTEYAIVQVGTAVATVSSDISGGLVRLKVTPLVSSNTKVDVLRTTITV